MIAASVLLEIVAGLLLADFMTGLIHWTEDRYGRETWPILGRLVIMPNRRHHAEPLAFTRTSFVDRNWIGALAAGCLGALLLLATGPSVWLFAACAAGALANECHFWAHRPDLAPRLVRALQRAHVLQSRSHHAQHHAAPQDRAYCVLTAWLNPLLDRAGFWPRLEQLLPKGWRA